VRSHEELLASVEAYYSGRLREHGVDARGVDWNSTESQHLRFAQLVRCLGPADRFTINDFGCGYGELAVWLRVQGLDATYTGYDISPAMVAAAEQHAAGEKTAFTTHLDALPVADYTVASGIFNVKLDAAPNEWEEYVWDTLALLHERSRRAFAFNMLTGHSDAGRKRHDLYYPDPGAVLDRCIRTYGRHAALVHDYGLYEFTLVVRREALVAV
jgi:hypothetical protein